MNALLRPLEAPGARGEAGLAATMRQIGGEARQAARAFALTPSARNAHLGPVRVSMQNLDPKRECFDLSVMLGDFRLERKHVRRFEAVWINLGGNNAPIRLIADRIGRNGVHGYLGTPAPKPPTSTSQRIKNAGSPARDKSLAQSPSSKQPNGG